jgi:hypothetical protein
LAFVAEEGPLAVEPSLPVFFVAYLAVACPLDMDPFAACPWVGAFLRAFEVERLVVANIAFSVLAF